VIAAHLLLAPRLRMGWNCTSGSLLWLYGHVTRWPLPLPYIDHSRFCFQTSTNNGFRVSFITWLSLTGTNHISYAWMKFDRILKNKLSYSRSVKATQEEQDEIGVWKLSLPLFCLLHIRHRLWSFTSHLRMWKRRHVPAKTAPTFL